MNRLLYFGAGIHFQPVFDFLQVKEFIFVDSQPYTEFFRLGYTYDKSFFRDKFVSSLKFTASLYGFEVQEETILDDGFFWSTLNPIQKACYKLFPRLVPQYVNPTLIKFYNYTTLQTVKYYVSNPFPYSKSEQLVQDIRLTDGLIVSGYHPDKSVLDFWSDKNIKFIGYSSTWFGKSDPEDLDPIEASNIIHYLHTNNDESGTKHFNEYIFVKDKFQSFCEDNDIYGMQYEERIIAEAEFIKTKPISQILSSDSWNSFLQLVESNKKE